MQDFKTCTKCGAIKHILEFSFRNDRGIFNTQCKSCVSEKSRAWKQKNKEKSKKLLRFTLVKTAQKLTNGQEKLHPLHAGGRAARLFNSAKNRASVKGFDFTITVDQIHVILMIGKCQKTDVCFDLKSDTKTNRNPYAPSVDRIDNSKGYTPDNIQIVCNMYNAGKGEATEEQFLNMCVALVKKQGVFAC